MNFYILDNLEFSKSNFITEFYSTGIDNTEPAEMCGACGKYISSLKWLPPYEVEIENWGGTWGDIAFGPGDNVLVSDFFREKWVESNLKGLLGFHPADVKKIIRRGKKIKEPPPNYFVVHAVGSKAYVDNELSELERDKKKPYCKICNTGGLLRFKRVTLKEDTLGDEDVFVSRGLPGTIITNQKFKDFCDKNEFKNVVLIPAEQYSLDFYPAD